ncbi:MAG: methyltransferase domain-containing protein [Endozoicomonas sp.]|uniref:methyltransferase domain-containing protein n=1 Tax=Endozoicomonas sp. TaxID=1892382 RepID=UPI003D9B6001
MNPDFSQFNQLKNIYHRAESLAQKNQGHTRLGVHVDKQVVSEDEFTPEAQSSLSSWMLGYMDYRSVKTFDDASRNLKETLESCCTAARDFSGMSVSVLLTPNMSSQAISEEGKKLVESEWGQFQDLHKSVIEFLQQLDQLTPADDQDAHTEETLNYFKNKMLISFNEKLMRVKNPKVFRSEVAALVRELNHLGAPVEGGSKVREKLVNRLLNGLHDLAIEPTTIPAVPAETGLNDRMECALEIVRATCDSFDHGIRGQQIRAHGQKAATQLEKVLKGCEIEDREKLILQSALDHQLSELSRRNRNLAPENQAMDPLIRTINAAKHLIKTGSDEADSQPASLSDDVHVLIEKSTAKSDEILDLSEVAKQSEQLLKEKLSSLTEEETATVLSDLTGDLLATLPNQSPMTQRATKQVLKTAETFAPKTPEPSLTRKQPHQDFAETLSRKIAFDCSRGHTGRNQQRNWFESLNDYLKGYPDNEHPEVADRVLKLVETTLRYEVTPDKQAALNSWGEIKAALELPPRARPKQAAQKLPFHLDRPDDLPRRKPTPPPTYLASAAGASTKSVRNDETVITNLWTQINRDISDNRAGPEEQKGWFDSLNNYLQQFDETTRYEIFGLAQAQIQLQMNEQAERYPTFANHLDTVDAALLMTLTGHFQPVSSPATELSIPPEAQVLQVKPTATALISIQSSDHQELVGDLFRQIKGHLLTQRASAENQSQWHQALAGHLYDFDESQRPAIVQHVVENVLVQLTVEAGEHKELKTFLPLVKEVLQQGISLDFKPVTPPTSPVVQQEPVAVEKASTVPLHRVPEASPGAPLAPSTITKMPVATTEWPSFNGQQLGLQAGILFETPRHLLVGMDDRGNLTFNEQLTPDVEVQIARLQKGMEGFIVQQVLPATGASMNYERMNKLHLPPQPAQCTVAKLQEIVGIIAGNPLAINMLAVEPLSEDVRKRFDQCEGKIMVIGCGSGYEQHKHLHPEKTTFTTDINAGMLPDLHGDVTPMLHMLPDKEHFSVIYFEQVTGTVFSDPDKIKATLKKCHRLLKPGGMVILTSGAGAITKTIKDLDIRYTFVECLTDAGFDNFKYTHNSQTKQAFKLIDPDKPITPQIPASWQAMKSLEFIPERELGGINIVAYKPD